MNKREVLRWARLHHYPQLILNVEEQLVLPHGKQAWHRALRLGQPVQDLIQQRIERWQEREQAL